MNNNFVITIDREFASGGREIARKLAEKLGVKMYDEELIGLIAKDSGLNEEVLQEVDETATNSFLYALSSGAFTGTSLINHGVDSLPITDKAFITCAQIIKDIAERESCIIVGRCAESVLKGRENLLKVFVYSDMENRIDRICEFEGVSRDSAATTIKRSDKKRANYHNYYSDTRWGSRAAYDLCVNSKLGIDVSVDIILTALKNMH